MTKKIGFQKGNKINLGRKRPDLIGNKFSQNRTPWNKGLIGYLAGEKHYNWKGNKVGYYALHHWIRKKLGKANHCEICSLDKIPKGKKRYFQWANKDGKYRRDLRDWIQACVQCHKNYDNANSLHNN